MILLQMCFRIFGAIISHFQTQHFNTSDLLYAGLLFFVPFPQKDQLLLWANISIIL